jgi:hypothetical protein
VGDLIWRTKDPSLEGRVRASYESVPAAAARKLPVRVEVAGKLGAPLVLTLVDEEGRRAAAETEVPLQVRCRPHSTTPELLFTFLSSFGPSAVCT